MATSDYTKEGSEYFKKNPEWGVGESPWKATQILKMIKRNNLQPHTVAEIGCGAGEILNQLYERIGDETIEFSGYDIAPDAIKLAKTREKERLHFFLEDLTTLDKEFDLLLIMDVFEHVQDYIGFINICKTKATYKIYHIPLDISFLSIFNNYPLAARSTVGHLHSFMKDTAIATLKDSDQEIIDWFYTHSSFEIYNKSFSAKFINVFRRFFYWINPNLSAKLFGGFSLLVLTK